MSKFSDSEFSDFTDSSSDDEVPNRIQSGSRKRLGSQSSNTPVRRSRRSKKLSKNKVQKRDEKHSKLLKARQLLGFDSPSSSHSPVFDSPENHDLFKRKAKKQRREKVEVVMQDSLDDFIVEDDEEVEYIQEEDEEEEDWDRKRGGRKRNKRRREEREENDEDVDDLSIYHQMDNWRDERKEKMFQTLLSHNPSSSTTTSPSSSHLDNVETTTPLSSSSLLSSHTSFSSSFVLYVEYLAQVTLHYLNLSSSSHSSTTSSSSSSSSLFKEEEEEEDNLMIKFTHYSSAIQVFQINKIILCILFLGCGEGDKHKKRVCFRVLSLET